MEKGKTENRLSIGKINGVEIYAVKDEKGKDLVPIKPICQALGVNTPGQIQKIQSHRIYSSVVWLSHTTGADGKQYEMLCIDAEFVYGWLMGINPDNVSDQVRDSLIKYQLECHHALYRYFHGRGQRQQDLLEAEREAIARLSKLDERIKESDAITKELKAERAKTKSDIDQIRASRLDDQPSLFD